MNFRHDFISEALERRTRKDSYKYRWEGRKISPESLTHSGYRLIIN
jgi:hypothetical protein